MIEDSLDTLIANTTHVVNQDNGRVKCVACLNSFKTNDTSLKAFLRTHCSAISRECDRPATLANDTIHLGNRVAHSSHKLAHVRGLFYCKVCGMRGNSRLHNLSRPCGNVSEYGKRNIKDISQGELPYAATSVSPYTKEIDRSSCHGDTFHFQWIRIKRPRLFSECSTALPLFATSSSSVTQIEQQAPQLEDFLPPHIVNLIELYSLEEDGEKVNWPDGVNKTSAHNTIMAHFGYPSPESSPSPSSSPASGCPQATSSATVGNLLLLDSNRLERLKELIDLEDFGEPMSWPEGLDSSSARTRS